MKTSKIQNIIFYIFLIIGSSSLLCSNIMMRNHPANAYLIPILILPILIFILFFSKINLNIKDIINNKILNIISLLYTIISSFIHVLAYLKITNDYFYNLTPPFLILIIILLLSIYFSSYGINNIFNIGFVISIFCFLLIIITIFFNPSFLSLKTNMFNNIKIENKFYLLSYIFIYIDILFISIFNKNSTLSKKSYLLIIIVSIIINSLLIIQNYLLFRYEFFISNKIPYISKYLVISSKNIFEHFDLLYLIFITLYIITKLSLNIEIFRVSLKIKRNEYKIFSFLFILLIPITITKKLKIDVNIINYIMIISSILLLIILSISSINNWRKYGEKYK